MSPDFDSFLPDLILVIVGAVFTVAIAWGAYHLEQRRREKGELAILVRTLARKRSLVAVTDPSRVNADSRKNDIEWCARGILAARDSVDRARHSIRSYSSAVHDVLDDMTRSCNVYLEASERDPDGYVIALMKLRSDLVNAVEAIARESRMKAAELPGSKAL